MKAFKTLEEFHKHVKKIHQEQESISLSVKFKQLAVEFNSLVDIDEYRANNKEYSYIYKILSKEKENK
jgi:hypothetical protein